MSENLTINMNIEQARAVKTSLEIFSRLSMGQLEMLAEMVSDGTLPIKESAVNPRVIADFDQCDDFRKGIDDLKALLSYGVGSNNGIAHDHVDIKAKRSYEVYKSLAQALFIHDGMKHPNVDADGLMLRYTSDPKPTVRIDK